MRNRGKLGTRTITLREPILRELEAIWLKSNEPNDFSFWFKDWLKVQLKKNKKRKRK